MNKMKCFLSKKMLLAVAVLLSVGYVQAHEVYVFGNEIYLKIVSK